MERKTLKGRWVFTAFLWAVGFAFAPWAGASPEQYQEPARVDSEPDLRVMNNVPTGPSGFGDDFFDPAHPPAPPEPQGPPSPSGPRQHQRTGYGRTRSGGLITTDFDQNGKPITETRQGSDGKTTLKVEFDKDGKPTRETHYRPDGTVAKQRDHVDAEGNRLKEPAESYPDGRSSEQKIDPVTGNPVETRTYHDGDKRDIKSDIRHDPNQPGRDVWRKDYGPDGTTHIIYQGGSTNPQTKVETRPDGSRTGTVYHEGTDQPDWVQEISPEGEITDKFSPPPK